LKETRGTRAEWYQSASRGIVKKLSSFNVEHFLRPCITFCFSPNAGINKGILVLDSLGSAIVCAVCSFAVFAPTTLDVPTATMAISYSLMTRGKLQFCIRLSIETENQFVAAERLQHLEKLALSYQEVQHSDISQHTISKSWPQGSISFKEVLMHYRPEHPVLNGLNLEILAGQKVGLVGRTGSGKSSLLSALLRITEISSGAILVDGVNVGEIDLKKLRESISLVPQEPILWSGSVAENLDPSGIASEETLMQALRKVHLDQKLPQGLAMMVETRGNNFSLGQRQLLLQPEICCAFYFFGGEIET